MNDRTCAWCGGSMEGKAARAVYCSIQHKKNAASVRHRQRNPGYYKRYDNDRGRKTPEQIKRVREYAREYQRKRRAADPVYAQAANRWLAAHPEARALHQSKRRAAERGNRDSRTVTDHEWHRLVRRYSGCCAYCGAKAKMTMDHVVPISRGGRHAIGNLLPACWTCNRSKGARLLADWRYRR